MAEAERDVTHWLAQVRAGSREALGPMLDACRGYLLMIARQALDPALQAKGGASDLVQSALLEAVRDWHQFHGTTEAELLAWLRQLLLNNVANFVRHYRSTEKRRVDREVRLGHTDATARPGCDPDSDCQSPSDVAVAREEDRELEQAVARLPEDAHRVITLRYQQDRSFDDIGRELGCSPSTARRLWVRAVEQLRRELDGQPANG